MIMFTALLLFLCVNLVSAAWGSLSTDLDAWWKMDGDSTNIVNSSYDGVDTGMSYVAGHLGDAAYLSGAGARINITDDNFKFAGNLWSINFWVNNTAITEVHYLGTWVASPSSGWLIGTGNGNEVSFENSGATGVIGTLLIKNGIYSMVTLTRNATSWTLYINGSFDASGAADADLFNNGQDLTFGWITSASSTVFSGELDEIGIWSRTLTTSEVSDLWNGGTGLAYGEAVITNLAVTLTSPVDTFTSSAVGLNFTGNYTSSNVNLTNATYYVWDSTGAIFNDSETVLITGSINGSTKEINNFTLEDYHWNIHVCGVNATQTVCAWAANNYTLTIGATINNETHIANVWETANERFELNVTLISGATLYLSKLYYNGTPYTATILDLGANKYSTYRTIDIPTVKSNYENLTFFWSLTYEKTDGSFINQNLTTYTQPVNITHLELCNVTYTIAYINFTTKNATNPFPNVNATFKVAWNYWLGSGDVKKNQSFEDISEGNHSFNFCVKPEYKTLYTDAQIEFDGIGSSQNYHYLTSATLTNVSSLINLYLLDNSEATLTVLQVYDDSQDPLENVSISIQYYDVGTDTYYTVGMAKTSFNGKDIVYLNWYDSFYKFILTQNGEVIKTTSPYKISETPQIFEIIPSITFDYDKFRELIYTLIFNNATDNFVLTFTDPTGLVNEGCLSVVKRTFTNDTQICRVCTSSSSATLYCSIAGYGNGTFIATFYATGSLWNVDSIKKVKGAVNELYDLLGNVDGTIYAFLFAGITLAMFFVSPVLAILGLMLGMLGAIVMGFQPLYYTEFFGIVIMGGFVIWLLKR